MRSQLRKLQGSVERDISELMKLNDELRAVASREGQATRVVGKASSNEVDTLSSHLTIAGDLRQNITQSLEKAQELLRVAGSEHDPTIRQRTRRFCEIFDTLAREFRVTSAAIAQRSERMELFGSDNSVKRELQSVCVDDDQKNLLRERGALDGSLNMLDDVLASAHGSHRNLQSQSGKLGGVSGKMREFAGKFRGIDLLMGRIRRAKQKQQIVLASTFSVLLLLTLLYMFR